MLVRWRDVSQEGLHVVRFWDLAATQPQKKNRAPDYTAGVLLGLYDHTAGPNRGRWLVIDARRCRRTPARTEEFLLEATVLDDCRFFDGREVPIRAEQEGGSGGPWTIDSLARGVMVGRNFQGRRPDGKKTERAKGFSIAAENTYVDIVEGPWNEMWLDEWELFPDGEHDDLVDATSGAFDHLRKNSDVADVVTLQQPNAWAF